MPTIQGRFKIFIISTYATDAVLILVTLITFIFMMRGTKIVFAIILLVLIFLSNISEIFEVHAITNVLGEFWSPVYCKTAATVVSAR